MKFIKWLDAHFEEYILSFLLALISCVMMLQVIMRYVFDSSLSWAEELSRYAFIWSTFVSVGYTIKKKTILKVDTFLEILPSYFKKIIKVLAECIVLAFFVYLFINSIPVTKEIYLSGQISPAMGIPMYLIYGSTIVGFFLAIVRSIQSTIGILEELCSRNKTDNI